MASEQYATDKAVNGAVNMLEAIFGDRDWQSEKDLEDTPKRLVKMLQELNRVEPFKMTTFASDADEMVIVKDIRFVSLCEHHIAPFIGTAHFAYVPNGSIVGISKIPRLIKQTSKGLWTQEHLTNSIVEMFVENLNPAPLGVALIMEATHTCMAIRGVQEPNAITITSKMTGCFADHSRQARAEFLAMVRK